MANKKAPPTEDPEQSRRFLETVRELEAAGELSATDAEGAFDRAFQKIVPVKRPAEDS